MSDQVSGGRPPQRKTKKIVLTVMGVAAVGMIGLAMLGGGDEGDGEEVRRNAYRSKADCVADYSEAQCEPQQASGGSGSPDVGGGSSGLAWIGPAYLAGRMMGGGFGGQSGFTAGQPGVAGGPMPAQRREEQQSAGSGSGVAGTSAGYSRPGAIANDPGPGRTQGTAAAVSKIGTTTVSRGGFGSSGRSFSSSSSS
jgi:uncharacterized protein YgiB involved in biofilm formation